MKTRKSCRVILSAFTVVFSASIASGQFAEDALRFSQLGLGVGARALAMGNATVGLVSDYSALFWNPAGLATVRSYEFSVGLSGQSYGNEANFFGVNTKTSNTSTNLNNLGLVYPVPTRRGSLTFAFGFGRVNNYTSNASFDGFNPNNSIVQSMIPGTNLNALSATARQDILDNNIPYQLFIADIDTVTGRLVPLVTGNVQQNVTVREGGGLNHWSFGGAIDIARELSLGAAFNVVSGSYTYDRQYIEEDIKNVYVDNINNPPIYDFARFIFESTINSNISGYNGLFGLMYRKQGVMKFGLAVRTPTIYEIEETFSDDGRSYFDNGDNYDIRFSNSTRYKITTPIVLSGGASFQLGDWLVVGGDAEYTDWTQMEFNTDNPDLIEENRVIKRVFRPTTNLRGGAELTIWDLGLKLRGGLVWNPSPFKADENDMNYDQVYYTAGAGFIVDDNTSLNVAYALGTWKTLRDNYYLSSIPNPSRTNERVNTNIVNVTLSYRF